jgi:hypothetical protein
MSVSEAIRQSAGWPRATSTQPDLPPTRTERPPRQTSGPALQGRNGQPGTAGRSRHRSRRTECRRRPRTEGTGAGRDRGRPGPRWVRAASETAGPRRASAVTTANQNRRSHAIHRHDLGRRSSVAPGSSPSSGTHVPGHLPAPSRRATTSGPPWGHTPAARRDSSVRSCRSSSRPASASSSSGNRWP